MEIDITGGFLSWGYALFILAGALIIVRVLGGNDGVTALELRVAELERRVLNLQAPFPPVFYGKTACVHGRANWDDCPDCRH